MANIISKANNFDKINYFFNQTTTIINHLNF